MRGIKVDAARLRQIRRARGFTQQELARLAGVGERTVRNAERGFAIRVDFLQYLAVALGVEWTELACDSEELRVLATEQARVDRLMTAVTAYAFDGDFGGYRELLASNVRLRALGPSAIPFTGEYHGLSGLQTLYERSNSKMVHDDDIDFSDIRCSGNLVVIQFTDRGQVLSTGKRFEGWAQHIYEFENGRVVRADTHFDTQAFSEAFT